MDQQILSELFSAVIEAGAVLGKDTSLYQSLLSRLRPVVIASDGRILEWMNTDKQEIKIGHRHISHLFTQYPGRQITESEPESMVAARKTLETRLSNGGGHTGWSRGWIVSIMESDVSSKGLCRFQKGDREDSQRKDPEKTKKAIHFCTAS